jgi:RNA polymerase primary sigma factor
MTWRRRPDDLAFRKETYAEGHAMSEEQSLEFYLRQIHCIPLLSETREKELARLIIRDHDPAARDELVRANLRLVVWIARKYARQGVSMQDLIEEGNIGLLKAVECFNPELNVRFSVYASWWIHQAVQRALAYAARPVRVPLYMVEMIAKWKKTVSELEGNFGGKVGLNEVATRMGISLRKAWIIERVINVLRRVVEAQTDDAEGSAREEKLGDKRASSPDRIVLDQDEINAVRRLFQKIDLREAQILRLRFGLEGNEEMTLKEIGERVGLTRERVRQIEDEALGKLKAFLGEDRPFHLSTEFPRCTG